MVSFIGRNREEILATMEGKCSIREQVDSNKEKKECSTEEKMNSS